MYTNLESTSYRQVNLDGLNFDAAAGGTTPYVIIDSGTSPLAGPITDVTSASSTRTSVVTVSVTHECLLRQCSVQYLSKARRLDQGGVCEDTYFPSSLS